MVQRPARIRLSPGPAGSRQLTAEEYQSCFLIAYAEPAYPPEGEAKGIEGKVLLDDLIGTDGVIQSLSVRSGHPLLAEAAVETVRYWLYRPLTLNGIPVEVRTQIEVDFRASDLYVASAPSTS